MSYEYDPITCEDCDEQVVVTRDHDAQTLDDEIRFECECSVGSIGAVKPESWEGASFL